MRWKIRTLFLLLAACTFQTVQSAAGQSGTTSGQSNVINLLCKGDYFKAGEGHIYIDLDKREMLGIGKDGTYTDADMDCEGHFSVGDVYRITVNCRSSDSTSTANTTATVDRATGFFHYRSRGHYPLGNEVERFDEDKTANCTVAPKPAF